MQALGVGVPLLTTGYGVFSKYANSVSQISDEIRSALTDVGISLLALKFDVFGFGRGAATARHFVNMVKYLYPSMSILWRMLLMKNYVK